jgi:adenosylcobinamide-GDP ribazoletransferase
MIASLRLAFSLLTVLPVRAPRTVDRHRAGWAMTLAPLVGLLLAFGAALLVFGTRQLFDNPGASPLPALLGLGALAIVTGGLHLDGLADLADGIGARRDAAGTLAVMREPTVGAFAVIALVFVLGLQTFALTLAIARHHGTVTMIVGVLAGRLLVPLACAARTPAARPEGLGALVVGTVPRSRAAVVLLLGAGVALLAGRNDYHGGGPAESLHALAALAFGLAVGDLVRRGAVRKLGGLNGDVLGAVVELATTATMVAMAIRVPRFLY